MRIIQRSMIVMALLGGTVAATGTPASAIIGGRDATQTYPGVSSLNVALPDGRVAWCGATLVHPRFLLTAAHCVSEDAVAPTPVAVPGNSVTARVGSSDRRNGTFVTGKAVYLHPDWMWGVPTGHPISDLALVELTKPVRAPIMPIGLGQLGSGSRVRLVGWGLTQFPPPQPAAVPFMLQQRDTSRLPSSACTAGSIGAGEVCVDNGACYGDSGSPSVRRGPFGWVSIGIASRTGTSCDGPAVYTDPTYTPFRGWMITKIFAPKPIADPCTCPPTIYSAESRHSQFPKYIA